SHQAGGRRDGEAGGVALLVGQGDAPGRALVVGVGAGGRQGDAVGLGAVDDVVVVSGDGDGLGDVPVGGVEGHAADVGRPLHRVAGVDADVDRCHRLAGQLHRYPTRRAAVGGHQAGGRRDGEAGGVALLVGEGDGAGRALVVGVAAGRGEVNGVAL